MNWLRRFFGRDIPAPTLLEDARKGESTEEVEAEWQNKLDLARMVAYQQGVAVGEYRGRMALAKEIEAEFSVTSITEDDAHRIVHKQTH